MLCGHQNTTSPQTQLPPTLFAPPGCSPAAGPGRFVKAELEMNGEKYREILQSRSAREQRGNAPRHTGKTTQRWTKTLFLLCTLVEFEFYKELKTVQIEGTLFWFSICTQCIYWKKYDNLIKYINKIKQVSKVQPH